MSKSNLPPEWETSTLGTVVDSIVGGGTPSKSNSSFYTGSIPWMSVKDMNKNVLVDTVDHITQEAVDNSSTNVVPAGTPIVATRMSLGKIVTANFDSAINQDLKALFLNKNVEVDYIIYWYRSISRLLESLGTGTTVKGIRLEVLRSLDLPLPPQAEQKQITSRLDTLLAQVDTLKSRLESIPAIFKRFRESVLAAAVSGRMTEGWREENGTQPWTVTTLAKLDIVIQIGPFGSLLHKRDYIAGGIPLVNPMHIVNGNIRPSDSMTVAEEKAAELQRYRLRHGDIVLGRRGKMGRTAVVADEALICGTGSLFLRPAQDKYEPHFLGMFLSSPQVIKYLESASVGSTMTNLNKKILKNMTVPNVSKVEQTEIVHRVEQLFAFANQIEQRVKNAQSQVNLFTQSILAKAFRGELTAEWREQNPGLISGKNSSDSLLKRIKEEKIEVVWTKSNNLKSVKTKVGKNMKPKLIIPVSVALKAAGTQLTAQALLTQSGYSSEASTEELEGFFLDIREQLKLGLILRERSGDEDVFTLVK